MTRLERAIGRHETREHRTHQLRWIFNLSTRLMAERLCIGDQITVNIRREIDREFDRLFVQQCAEFQLGHAPSLSPCKAQAPGRD